MKSFDPQSKLCGNKHYSPNLHRLHFKFTLSLKGVSSYLIHPQGQELPSCRTAEPGSKCHLLSISRPSLSYLLTLSANFLHEIQFNRQFMNASHEPDIILGIQITELTPSRRSQTN